MIPLCFAEVGEEYIVQRMAGSPETKLHLQDLGFVPGVTVLVLSSNGGDIIVSVKNTRVAIGRELAENILL